MTPDTKVKFRLELAGAVVEEVFPLSHFGYDGTEGGDLDSLLNEDFEEWECKWLNSRWDII